MVPPVGIAELHMDPPEPAPVHRRRARCSASCRRRAIDAFVAAAGPGSGSPLASVELRHLGGALGGPAPDHGALETVDASFMTFAVGMVMDDESYTASRAQIDRVAEALAPYDNGRQYLNFTEEHTDPARFYAPDAYPRLREVKAAFDPENVIRSNHPIRRPTEAPRPVVPGSKPGTRCRPGPSAQLHITGHTTRSVESIQESDSANAGSMGAAMELGGLEPLTSWVRSRPPSPAGRPDERVPEPVPPTHRDDDDGSATSAFISWGCRLEPATPA